MAEINSVYEAARRHGEVLGMLGHLVCVDRKVGYQSCVTWAVGSDGSMNHGHYFKYAGDALEDLIDRFNGEAA